MIIAATNLMLTYLRHYCYTTSNANTGVDLILKRYHLLHTHYYYT